MIIGVLDLVAISGATGTTYTVAEPVGSAIVMEATLTDDNGTAAPVFSNALTVVNSAIINSVTYDTAGFVVDYNGELSATYDTAGIALEVS